MIKKPYLDDVCRIGQGAACCRYLVVHPYNGFQCAKLTTLRSVIDARVGRMAAQSDNCDGLPED